MADYFFELLTEEIPAWMHDAAAATLRERLGKLAADLGGKGDDVTVNTTTRRIVFLLKNLPLREEDREQEVKGPPKKAAYDADGNPTPALHGFLKKQNATLADIIAGDDAYVQIRRKITGRETGDALRDRIPEVIEGIRWPKMMTIHAGETSYSYIRPVHSVISIFDGAHLPLSIFGIASGTRTVGHRTLAPKSFEVTSYNDYVSKLELARVVVDPLRRREVMAARARTLANEVNGTPSTDATIWSQWQYLTEYPGVVRAEFRRDYLALPEEVLVTVMRVHQKQLPIRDREEKLTNSFLAVLDNEGDPEGNAAYGNSFVTNARFADAQFFYETDRRKALEERLEQLEHLQFQEKLGNYRDKTRRIEQIANGICELAGIDKNDVATAARLCKTDLVTEMVKEFTDLQGRVGGIYAREEGLGDNVWQAIYDHYQPVSIDDALPRTASGAVVSLADRIDTLVGFFSIGAKPTGSKDPFGLRRAAQGVVQILLNRDKREIRIGIEQLVDLGIAAYANASVRSDLLAFFAERVRTILEASAWQFAYDEIAAAMESGWSSSLTDLVDRVAALKATRDDANFLSILDSAKRIANITEGHTSTRVDTAKLEHATERRLAELAEVVTGQIDELIAGRQYRVALESFAAMAPELETFFKDVMVNVENPDVRANRMSLLRKVGGAATKIADVTKIVVDRRDYRA
ncbi:MAG TPA: glycine--tRNA ligase subunit beta [Thermoanaerobaculia bacterium]|nr:glycine--tRNA ligase subunit beta [Thermoanaerobaculia bacterium]